MKTLVTGGAGFIGSHVVDRLVEQGARVLVLDDLSSGRRDNIPGGADVDLELVDVAEARAADLIRAFAPEVTYHLAAQPSVTASTRDPMSDARINALGTINVARACAEAGARKLVYAASGGTLYGEPPRERFPVPETDPWVPISPYGLSKKIGIDYLRLLRDLGGVPWTALALANVYGPRQDPHGEAGVVAIWGRRLLAGQPCEIFGDGEQTRDFVYVADVADAFVSAAERGEGRVLNIGTQTETSVNELYRTMAALAGAEAGALYRPARPGELRAIVLDIVCAREVLSWEPRVGLRDGLARTLDSMRAG